MIVAVAEVSVVTNKVVFSSPDSTQHVPPPAAVATETEDANISAERFQIDLTSVSALRATVWTGTTSPASPKVRAPLQDDHLHRINTKGI